MNKEELMEAACNSIMDADEDKALEIIDIVLKEGFDLIEVLREGFGAGNKSVGDLFESGRICLPELIISTEVMKKVIEVVETHSSTNAGNIKGRLLIATVDGDVHEIGKGMVASALQSYGFEVIDLGREVAVETIIVKAEEYNVDIIATSALLTSTLKEQKKLEDALNKMGLRKKYKTMVGGAPCTLRWSKRIGADAYSEDAIEAVKKAFELLGCEW